MMFELEKDTFKLTHVSRKLDLNSSESHRQLPRLSEMKLVVKDVEGSSASHIRRTNTRSAFASPLLNYIFCSILCARIS